MIVLKFGGTSVADAEAIRGVADRVREAGAGTRVVVVSALAGVTDELALLARRAAAGDRAGVDAAMEPVARRHREVAAELGVGERDVERHDLDERLRALRVTLAGLRHLGRSDDRTTDSVLAFGELLSTGLVAAALARAGLPTLRADPRELIVTEPATGGARPDREATDERLRAFMHEYLAEGQVAVVGGFVGATRDGVTTNLGRGGSDLTAALIGAALGAERVEIWSDVEGLMTADPRLVPEARHLTRVSMAEASALAQYGAGILHPETLAPAVEAGIPVVLRNSRRPTGEGTLITARPPRANGVRALSCLRGVGLARLRQGPGASRTRLLGEALARLEAEGMQPRFLAQSEGTLALLLNGGDLPRVPVLLRALGDVETIAGLGVVCVVGEAADGSGAPSGRVLRLVESETVHLVAGGAGRAQVAIVLPAERAEPVLRSLHRSLVEDRVDAEVSER